MTKKPAKVTIRVHDVGQAFGHEAHVRSVAGRRTIHVTRVVPYGMRGAAYDLAQTWAKDHGHELVEAT